MARPKSSTSPDKTVKILLVEDDPTTLHVLARRLRQAGYEVVPCAEPKSALINLTTQTFDVLVTDLRMAPMDGLELLRVVRTLDYRLPSVVITGYADKENAIQALNLGAGRMLEKPFQQRELMEAIQAVVEDREHPAQPISLQDRDKQVAGFLDTLPVSNREREILGKLTEGLTNREIAEALNISERTVKNHLVHIYQKLEVDNRSQLFNMVLHGI